MNKDVPMGDAVQFGLNTFGRNALFLVGVFIVVTVVNWTFAIVQNVEPVKETFASFLLYILQLLTTAVLEMGVIAISLQLVDGRKPEFGDLFNRVPLVFNYIGAGLLYVFMVVVGLVFLIIPGIIVAVRFFYFCYFVVDQQRGPVDALQKSWELTRGVSFELLMFFVFLLALNILGVICLIIGVYISLPVTALANAYVFRHLQPPIPTEEAAVQPAI